MRSLVSGVAAEEVAEDVHVLACRPDTPEFIVFRVIEYLRQEGELTTPW
jgi:hypothetical protein